MTTPIGRAPVRAAVRAPVKLPQGATAAKGVAAPAARELDTPGAKQGVAAVGVAGFTPLPNLELSDVKADPKLERKPTRTWSFEHGKATEVTLKARRAQLPPAPPYPELTEKELAKAVKAGHAERLKELKAGSTRAGSMVMPEDGSVKVKAFHLASLGSDATGFSYPLAMAALGKGEGFRVVLRIESERVPAMNEVLKKEKLDAHVTLVPLKVNEGAAYDDLDFWSEDQGELHVDGSVSVPRSMKKGEGIGETAAWRAILSERMARLHPGTKFEPKTDAEWSAVLTEHEDVAFSGVGGVSTRGGQRALAAIALANGKKVTVSNGYAEGGNSLVGRRANGEGYVVVGRDTLAVSRAQLEKDLGRKVTEPELIAYVAADYGVAPEAVVPVEQPGDFHIDMHMMLLPGGNAVLNDAMQVFELQKQWRIADVEAKKPVDPGPGARKSKREDYAYALEDWQFEKDGLPEELARMEERAREAAGFEARVAKDLEAGGLEVHRMAGVFPSTRGGEKMNF
ncbi:MAG: hypothetical protein JNK82_44435, partial [Myxococcaceae bacterium]|nr:hypothetical protein [Myxococcaceae bacterium]